MQRSRVSTDVDFERDGKQFGHLFLPYQTNKSAYGNICTPVCSIKNGTGPTLLLTAGVHGDEYEGQIALRKLIKNTGAEEIAGRLIILPSLNLPAVKAGTRLSPFDGMNLHGAFPGDPASTNPTSELAYYLETSIVPMANYLIDLHSGGYSLDYMPFGSIRLTGNEALDDRATELLEIFNAPNSVIWKQKNGRMLSSAAERNNIVALGGEFGGQGSLSVANLKIIEEGIERVLTHLNVKFPKEILASRNSRFLEVGGSDFYVQAKSFGMFEPFVELGQDVEEGEECGQLHSLDDLEGQPVLYHFKRNGLVICKRHPTLVEAGDCLSHLAVDVNRPS